MPALDRYYAELTRSGAPFELGEEDVLGEPMNVLANRAKSLAEILEASEQFDDREFLVSGERRITFLEHRGQVASLAQALREKYDIQSGDRVAILGANSPEWIVAFWAVTNLGAIAVGMNGWWSAREILGGLSDCQPKLIIGDQKRLSRIATEKLPTPVIEIERDFEALTQDDAEFRPTAVSEDDPACILYTSGTTGRAKGAVLSHRSLIASVGLQTLNGAAMFMASGGPPSAATVHASDDTPLSRLGAGCGCRDDALGRNQGRIARRTL